MGTIFEGMKVGAENESQAFIDSLFPYKDKFRMLQMLTRLNHGSHMPMTILGVFRRKYKSKFLAELQEEHNLNKIAIDGQGRGDLLEIGTHMKRLDEEAKE